MIKGRENKLLGGATQSADFLVCFPSRTHLTLMPKPICSPARGSEPSKRHHHNHHLKRINTRTSSAASGGPNSPLVWAKNNQLRPEIAEPTSPKVTCAGQIKVRPSSSSGCKNWQSVMEEIERIHNRGKTKKKSKWVEGFGFKKDVMSFLTCLRNIRFDFRCFGAFPQSNIISSDDEEDEDEEDQTFEDDEFNIGEDDKENNIVTNNSNKAVFSKWFMVLQEENEGKDVTKNSNKSVLEEKNIENDDECVPAVPPPNALLLMRCRSAPAKSWLEEKEIEAKEEEEKTEEEENLNKKKKRESLAILMKYDAEFYNLSTEISQETWVVGGFKDPFSRSRSWRR
ncbi:uncharacterized protein LOC110709674 [Chenopodium quinoa]|uniref:uncharacterized protein LOC110699148 n=1 Tax=Chenopodium quinoa TaxID=63459 RepID=UPI000B7705A1|nr:uncharacterized protein LOC110699148 [Chenopodium quinoa]XP_021743583.1 uncharacterized protein LOC110709674 [Chenopodium quinoa]